MDRHTPVAAPVTEAGPPRGETLLNDIEYRFRLIGQGPKPLSVDGCSLGHGLPRRRIALPELSAILMHPACGYDARDTAWRLLVVRARTGDPAWRAVVVAAEGDHKVRRIVRGCRRRRTVVAEVHRRGPAPSGAATTGAGHAPASSAAPR
jgi:hypothetical protein